MGDKVVLTRNDAVEKGERDRPGRSQRRPAAGFGHAPTGRPISAREMRALPNRNGIVLT